MLPLVYEELRRRAAQKLTAEKPGPTLQATALVHEADVRLVDRVQARHRRPWALLLSGGRGDAAESSPGPFLRPQLHHSNTPPQFMGFFAAFFAGAFFAACFRVAFFFVAVLAAIQFRKGYVARRRSPGV